MFIASEDMAKPGDLVRVVFGGYGGRGADGKIGLVVSDSISSRHGLFATEGGSNLLVLKTQEVWRLSPNAVVEMIRRS